ncbi:hypothetical protein GWK47_024225 [Chionoecetes opilio]|uniref:PHD-type domain-containing protein n=1 Tax=Chionoecetes opilio TaxID=41210 RepID=A0A8J5CJC0_CHIOP|nr:hypothetical protein GWK47_024225 [Chionoecetes opilio]
MQPPRVQLGRQSFRQPHVEGDCMIACDACQTCYHRDCEGISSHRWRNLQDYDTTYTCNSCRSTRSSWSPSPLTVVRMRQFSPHWSKVVLVCGPDRTGLG